MLRGFTRDKSYRDRDMGRDGIFGLILRLFREIT
jgi:hypothetical protein